MTLGGGHDLQGLFDWEESTQVLKEVEGDEKVVRSRAKRGEGEKKRRVLKDEDESDSCSDDFTSHFKKKKKPVLSKLDEDFTPTEKSPLSGGKSRNRIPCLSTVMRCHQLIERTAFILASFIVYPSTGSIKFVFQHLFRTFTSFSLILYSDVDLDLTRNNLTLGSIIIWKWLVIVMRAYKQQKQLRENDAEFCLIFLICI
jgi:hypothetical protein